MYRRWRRPKKPKPGIHGRPPFPCTVDCREPEAVVKGSLRRAKLRRALDHRLRFPRKITEKRERGALGHRLSELSYRATICQRSTGRSSLGNDCTKELLFPMCHTTCFEAGRFTQIQSSWTAYAVPANGWLVTLMRWPNLQRIQFGKPAQTVNPATVASPEILPISPRRCVFSLDRSLSWISFAKFGAGDNLLTTN